MVGLHRDPARRRRPPRPGRRRRLPTPGWSSGTSPTGEKTRFFNGHAGPVYALASSPDGRWLRHRLVRPDRPPLAAGRLRPAARLRGPVRATARRRVGRRRGHARAGFADGIALKPGPRRREVLRRRLRPAGEVDPAAILPRLDARVADHDVHASTPGCPATPSRSGPATTKRDSPALTLFPGVDRRVGPLDPPGLLRQLGRRRPQVPRLADQPGDRRRSSWPARSTRSTSSRRGIASPRPRPPTSSTACSTPATRSRPPPRPPPAAPAAADPTTSRLDELAIAPAVRRRAAAGPVAVAAADAPGRITGPSAAAGAARIRRALGRGQRPEARRPRRRRRPAGPRRPQGQVAVPVGDERDVRRSASSSIDAAGRPAGPSRSTSATRPRPPPAAGSRGWRSSRSAPTSFADKRFAAIRIRRGRRPGPRRGSSSERLVDPATGRRFAARSGPRPDRSSAAEVAAGRPARRPRRPPKARPGRPARRRRRGGRGGRVALPRIPLAAAPGHRRARRRRPEPRLDLGHRPGRPARRADPARLPGRRPGRRRPRGQEAGLGERHQGVGPPAPVRRPTPPPSSPPTTAPASPNGDGHRAFAQGVLDVLEARSAGRLRKPGGPMSLFDFQRTVTDAVLEKTGRKQHAQFYLPETISIQVPFLDPSNSAAEPGSERSLRARPRVRRQLEARSAGPASGDSTRTSRPVGPSSSIRTHQVDAGQAVGDEVGPLDQAEAVALGPVVGGPQGVEVVGAVEAVGVEVVDRHPALVLVDQDERRAGDRPGVDAQGLGDRPDQPGLARAQGPDQADHHARARPPRPGPGRAARSRPRRRPRSSGVGSSIRSTRIGAQPPGAR